MKWQTFEMCELQNVRKVAISAQILHFNFLATLVAAHTASGSYYVFFCLVIPLSLIDFTDVEKRLGFPFVSNIWCWICIWLAVKRIHDPLIPSTSSQPECFFYCCCYYYSMTSLYDKLIIAQGTNLGKHKNALTQQHGGSPEPLVSAKIWYRKC